MRVPLAPAVRVGYEINGVGVGTEENMKVLKVWCDCRNLTLNSDDGVGRDVSSERGSAGVESSLRC